MRTSVQTTTIMKKAMITILLAAAGAASFAQQAGGGISPEMLQMIQKDGALTQADMAVSNAMANVAIDDLARTREAKQPVNTYFSVETRRQSIHDQKSSGRCWMFSGLNVLRSDFAAKSDSLTVEYSHDYLFFWDQLEKANLFLQNVIETASKPLDNHDVQFLFKSPLNDGGTFCGVIDLAPKYGLVPKSVQPETFSAENTSRISRLIASKLREYGLELRKMKASDTKAKTIEQKKTQQLSEVYHMLCLAYGEPVKEFTYTFTDDKGRALTPTRTYTPMQFYQETVGKESLADEYVMVMNDPRNEYYRTYEVDLNRHVQDGHNWRYLNLPMEDIEQMAIAALKDGRKMYSSYDVGKFLNRKTGVNDLRGMDYGTLLGTDFPMTKAERIATFDSGSTHAMTLSAVDLDADGKPVKWKVENSWGPEHGQKGCLIMTAEWFREYMFRLCVNRQYVPQNILDMYSQKPVMLTHDDPLFQPED